MGSRGAVDETTTFRPTFNADGLIVAAATDAATGRLLMIAYMNEEALTQTLKTGEATYWSRSRRKLWRKGETSGATQKVKALRIDCDQDAIELVVEQAGPACHTGRKSCFYRVIQREDAGLTLLFED
ncbi:MAG: phosphoribosyl-AMP cyclohydrolase [Pseudomonadota bacterium]